MKRRRVGKAKRPTQNAICCPSDKIGWKSAMPQLPSGLTLAISRDALFDHGGNWFECPDGHFWYWLPGPEMGPAPFDPDSEIHQIAEHAPAPRNREDAKRFVHVLEMRSDGRYAWRGEWLHLFPRFAELDDSDLAAWNAWISRPEIDRFLEEVIAECARLAEVSRRAQGYAVLVGNDERDESGWIKANLHIPGQRLYSLEQHQPSEEFARCWQAAGRHIELKAQGPLHSWLKANLDPPFLEHLSFRLGNQLFFIRIEDGDAKLQVPGSRNGLLYIAEGCNGHPCLMPMQCRAGAWEAEVAGWGLVDARTGKVADPIAVITDERIEMTDWEVQDFAVQVVRDHVEKAGRKLISWQGNPAVDPSIWFVGDSGPEWVVVRAARYPQTRVHPPANWQQIAARCADVGKIGHFASVVVASADDAFDPTGAMPPEPLWRDHGMLVRFEGLETHK
jgi:hypothetical protein